MCYHSRKFVDSLSQVDFSSLPDVVPVVERKYACTKVIWKGWPEDFAEFIRSDIDWNSSPGYPWKAHYPTNRHLFGFDGATMDPTRVALVEAAVKARWEELKVGPKADPIFLFIKPEPHKIAKVEKKAWRLISGVGLTDTLVDRILYGDWLKKTYEPSSWAEIPSKAGWAPQSGGYRWLANAFSGKDPVSIDKSAWDWTVNAWHVDLIKRLVPRMLFKTTDEWKVVFNNRIKSLFYADIPVFRMQCGCEFTQLVTGIMKSGSLGTIQFNSICQFGDHIAAGGSEYDLFVCIGDDTTQDSRRVTPAYLEKLRKTGAIVKEADWGWPIKFAGHEITETSCVPAYRSKHAFNLSYLDPEFARETIDSYRHLYGLEEEFGAFLEDLALSMFGPENLLSRDYLREWYQGFE